MILSMIGLHLSVSLWVNDKTPTAFYQLSHTCTHLTFQKTIVMSFFCYVKF